MIKKKLTIWIVFSSLFLIELLFIFMFFYSIFSIKYPFPIFFFAFFATLLLIYIIFYLKSYKKRLNKLFRVLSIIYLSICCAIEASFSIVLLYALIFYGEMPETSAIAIIPIIVFCLIPLFPLIYTVSRKDYFN